MHAVRRPWWQQATALVTVSTGGVITGFNFVPGAAATMTSPTSVPVHLLALEQAGQPGAFSDSAAGGSASGVASDAQLRSAIVNVAGYYLKLAGTRTPAQMEALIWDNTSSTGADHGPSCAAFASLTLELAAQAVGQQSWVSGGSTYPWPMPEWADVRVDTNPASPNVDSLVADAEAHGRWHAVDHAYQPKPGDWVVFDGHVEVVTSDTGGVLHTIGADSLPDFTVNAHSFGGSLAGHGVTGFVDNGHLKAASTAATTAPATAAPAKAAPAKAAPAKATASLPATGKPAVATGKAAAGPSPAARPATESTATVPGVLAAADLLGQAARSAETGSPNSGSAGPGTGSRAGSGSGQAAAAPSGQGQHGSSAVAGSAASIPGLAAAASSATATPQTTTPATPAKLAAPAGGTSSGSAAAHDGAAVVPGISAVPGTGSWAGTGVSGSGSARTAHAPAASSAASPTATAPAPAPAAAKAAATPSPAAPSSPNTAGHQYTTPGTKDQQAFISLVAPGAMAAQQRYGVPAAVTIAQAIEESAWGRSGLAAQYHNLFGIKGTGPAGSVSLPTSEHIGGRWETIDAGFRVYHNDAESIADHAELLATSGYYTRAMADRTVPDAFANDLTGVYATDPDYGANLIALMKLYNLYQYDSSGTAAPAPAATHAATTPAATAPAATTPAATAPAATTPAASPSAASPSAAASTPAATPAASTPAAGTAAIPAARSAAAAAGSPAPASAGTHVATPGTHPAARASVPGVTVPALAPTAPPVTAAADATAVTSEGGSRIPGLVTPGSLAPARTANASPAAGGTATAATTAFVTTAFVTPSRGTAGAGAPGQGAPGQGAPGQAAPGQAAPGQFAPGRSAPAQAARGQGAPSRFAPGQLTPGQLTPGQLTPGRVTPGRVTSGSVTRGPARYEADFPAAVTTAYFASAKAPLARGQYLYKDVAACTGIGWQLLAAVDWMECKADPRRSPVHGEKLGSLNHDGTAYSTKSRALTQCACDLIQLAAAVYGIDLAVPRPLSVRALAAAFSAFRWGAILQRQGVSPMEFPYAVAGLTAQHQKMHWPNIEAPDAPDRPGARFREPFGAVPVVLSLGYPATA